MSSMASGGCGDDWEKATTPLTAGCEIDAETNCVIVADDGTRFAADRVTLSRTIPYMKRFFHYHGIHPNRSTYNNNISDLSPSITLMTTTDRTVSKSISDETTSMASSSTTTKNGGDACCGPSASTKPERAAIEIVTNHDPDALRMLIGYAYSGQLDGIDIGVHAILYSRNRSFPILLSYYFASLLILFRTCPM